MEDVARTAAARELGSATRASHDSVYSIVSPEHPATRIEGGEAYGSTSWRRRASAGSSVAAMLPVPPRPVVKTLVLRVGVWRSFAERRGWLAVEEMLPAPPRP